MMNLEGLEMIAVLVVVVVFVKVLEQFGLLEAGYDVKNRQFTRSDANGFFHPSHLVSAGVTVSDSSVPLNDTGMILDDMRAEMTLLTGS